MPRDYYEVLGVKRDADDESIKKAYRKLARDTHPDRNPGDKTAAARFKEIQEAYDILSDKKRRAQFDRFGFAGNGANQGSSSFHWGGGGAGGMGSENPEEILRHLFGDDGNAQDISGFSNSGIFGQKGGKKRGRRGREIPDTETEVTVPFNTAALGGTVGLKVNGTTIDVKIPAGVKEGSTLRLQNQAPDGGNLLLKIKVAPHPYFRRENDDLILDVPLSLSEAVLGTKVDVPTLDGSMLSVKVPPGASSGGRLRLRGKGINGGDQYIQIEVVVPSPADDRSRELIEEFARRNPQKLRTGSPWK